MRLWDEAKEAQDKGVQGMSDGLLMQAYSNFEEARGIYKDLDNRYPETEFAAQLHTVERHMGELQKAIGSGEW